MVKPVKDGRALVCGFDQFGLKEQVGSFPVKKTEQYEEYNLLWAAQEILKSRGQEKSFDKVSVEVEGKVSNFHRVGGRLTWK